MDLGTKDETESKPAENVPQVNSCIAVQELLTFTQEQINSLNRLLKVIVARVCACRRLTAIFRMTTPLTKPLRHIKIEYHVRFHCRSHLILEIKIRQEKQPFEACSKSEFVQFSDRNYVYKQLRVLVVSITS